MTPDFLDPAYPGIRFFCWHCALLDECKLWLRYDDKAGTATERRVWPVALGFFAEAEVLAA